MPLPFKLFITYMAVSFFAGLVVMVYDATRPTNSKARELVVMLLYMPPLGISGMMILGAILMAVWRS
jgi:hypothetical protein